MHGCRDYQIARRLGRRELLRAGSATLLGMTMPGMLGGRAAAQSPSPKTAVSKTGSSFGRAKSCILLFMWGGPAHQDTFDLKPDAPAEFRGEFSPIRTNVPGISICEHFKQLSRRVDQLCIVRSMTHNNADHTRSTHFLLTGEPPPVSIDKRDQWPHFGSVLARLGRGHGALPPFVSMRPKLPGDVPRFVEQSQGQFAGWLGPVYDPLTIDDDPSTADYRVAELALHPELSVERLHSRRALLHELDRQLALQSPFVEAHEASHRRAFELLQSAKGELDAFNLETEPRALRERYGLNAHGQSVLQARRLVERGVPLVTVFWPNDGIKNVSVYWDTHSRNFIDLKERLIPVADQAFSALLDDLRERGMLDETLVVWTGEFGRTPRVGQVNSDAGAGRDGRDHWPGCFTSVLAGGGFRGGFVYGKSDKHAAFPAENPVAPQDLIATVYHALGVSADQTLADAGGRPQFIRPGKTIHELLL
jgi:hypothetical protein